jgi:OTU domain-containing protein 6
MEDLLSSHRKEQKDLQGRITQRKKSATKKTRKGVNDECDRMQQELSDKQQAEIAQLNGDSLEGLDDLSLEDGQPIDDEDKSSETPKHPKPEPLPEAESTPESSSTSSTKKPNRQKARLARRAAEQAAQSAAAAEEAATQTNYRGNEQEVMDAVFKKLGLKEVEVTPDGHCLYSAVAKQLDESGLGLRPDPSRIVLPSATQSRIDTVASPQHDGYRAVRAVTADFITEHKEDFEAFMEEPLEAYTRKIKLTAEWGGQLELQAIARAYGVEINVVQSDGRMEKIESGESFDEEEKRKRVLWLAYYRHTYGLGEHYNSLVKS